MTSVRATIPGRRGRVRPRLRAIVAVAALVLAGSLAPAAADETTASDADGAQTAWRFDFGGPNTPVEEGWTQVTSTTLYDEDRGYGLDQQTDFRDRGAPDAVRRDFTNGPDYRFLVDVPDGDYLVTVISGDEIASNRTDLTVNGESQGRLSPSGTGEFAEHQVITTVTGGQLELRFQTDGRANGVTVTQVFAPTGLEVTGTTLTPTASVSLAWDAVDGAASYRVFRSPTGADAYELVGTTGSPSFTDETVLLGYAYDYTVSQVTADGDESAPSDAVTAAVVDPAVSPPGPVEDLRISRATPRETVVTWDAVDGALFYDVYRALSDNGPFERLARVDEPRFVQAGATETNHVYEVVAVNEGGISATSSRLLTPITSTSTPPRPASLDGCGVGRFDAQVIRSGMTWRVINDGRVASTFSFHEAVHAAFDSLTSGRSSQERVVVRGSGWLPADLSLEVPSHTSLEVCGTIHVSGNEAPFDYGNQSAAVRIRHAEDVSVPYLAVTGTPNFGVFVRTSVDVHLGMLDLRLSGGHGVRIDSRDDDTVFGARDIRIDEVRVSGTSSHGVETYGVDGLEIGTVVARDTGYSGLLLNQTINADIGLVDGIGAGTGTGYAAFRMANRNGRIGDGYPVNIRVGEVRARGGGRGIFCVSESGGAVIERVDLADTGGNAVLIENCYDITMATEGGVIAGPGDIRLAARAEFANTADITLENLTLRNTAINENPCAVNTVVRDITLENSQINTC